MSKIRESIEIILKNITDKTIQQYFELADEKTGGPAMKQSKQSHFQTKEET